MRAGCRVEVALCLLLGYFLALPACAGAVVPPRRSPQTPAQDLALLERKTFDAVNAVREKAGLARLAGSEELARVARAHSEYQARTGKTGHTGVSGSNPADRIRRAGIDYRAIAENVAMNQGYADPVEVAVDGWMKSAGHRKNILNPVFTQTGLGVSVGADGEVYFTQVFLVPPSSR